MHSSQLYLKFIHYTIYLCVFCSCAYFAYWGKTVKQLQFGLVFILKVFYRSSRVDLLWGMPWIKHSLHLNSSLWNCRLFDCCLEDWQVSIIFLQHCVWESLVWCGGTWKVAVYFLFLCPFLLLLFLLLSPLLFKPTSQRLYDQHSATWPPFAPAPSNLDERVWASEGRRHGWYTYST